MYFPLIVVALLLANLLSAQETVEESHMLMLCRNRHNHPLCIDVVTVDDGDLVNRNQLPQDATNALNDGLVQLERINPSSPSKRKASFIRFGKRLSEQMEKRKASFIRLG
ncbi:hypothetical protein Tcan_15212 [Toxocara canis]|uniref:Uncharacterized protein n=1 Tax=Toxocara canis TaxID=6265 RepID=A0A0B2W1G9_TOXCA|nr:hypothetical protein Tcan_15212 [Toxocara canis]